MCSKNREIVLRGLALRKARREEEARQQQEAQREAASEAQGAEMSRVINFRARFQEAEETAAAANERRVAHEAEQRKCRRQQAAKQATDLNAYIMRTFGCLLFAAIMVLFHVAGRLPFEPTMATLALAVLFCIIDGVEYMTTAIVKPHKTTT